MNCLNLLHDGLDGQRILSWMVFPNDPSMREAYLARKVMQHILESEPHATQVSLPTSLVRTLLSSPDWNQIQTLAIKATKSGTTAGDIIALIYETHELGHIEPSKRKAIKRYIDYFANTPRGRFGDGNVVYRTDASIRKALDEFHSVAHLWAASRLLGIKLIDFNEDHSAIQVLGLAKTIGAFATSFVPKRREKNGDTPLDNEQLIQIPDDIAPIKIIFNN